MSPEPTLWERSRQAALTEITNVAMRLILDQGFEQTTIDQIAETSGISRRSFFRYFRTKEDIVLGDLAGQGVLMQEALEAVPLSVGPWEALREALGAVEALEGDSSTPLKIATMMYETPSLRSRSIEKHLHWQSLLVPNIKLRLGTQNDQTHTTARAIVACCIACLDVAGEEWTKAEGAPRLADLYDQAVRGMRSAD